MADYAYPKDLIDGIKARWAVSTGGAASVLPNDDSLHSVLESCYHASLRTSEQRPVRCSVAYISTELLKNDALLRFELAVEFTADQIVRLAPIADIHRTLIGCDHIDGDLRIWGLFEPVHALPQYSSDASPEGPFEETESLPDCLTITVEGPGTLKVSRGRTGLLRLRDGQVIVPQQNPMRDENSPLGFYFLQLVNNLARSLEDRHCIDPSDDKLSLLGVYTRTVVAILHQIRHRREGGSIVIARTPLDAHLAQITYTVAGHTGLADGIVNLDKSLRAFRQTVSSLPTSNRDVESLRVESELNVARQHLFRSVNQISLLAGVDGAVLLDDNLAIQGFGVRFSVVLPIGTKILDAATGIEYPCDQWGLRHQSVFSLCQQCDSAVGLIVSHDGIAKAVKSVNGKLHLWDRILD